MNLRYPDIYGVELHRGSETLKNCVIYACRQFPVFNNYEDRFVDRYGIRPFAFIVQYNPTTDQDEKDDKKDLHSGTYLCYRARNVNDGVGTCTD